MNRQSQIFLRLDDHLQTLFIIVITLEKFISLQILDLAEVI